MLFSPWWKSVEFAGPLFFSQVSNRVDRARKKRKKEVKLPLGKSFLFL
jgi:hypothetical protein